MIAAVVLVLMLVTPAGIRTQTQPMPDARTCEAAQRAWLAGERDAEGRIAPDRSTYRVSACVAVPVVGRDA